jgi:hypothetical protein
VLLLAGVGCCCAKGGNPDVDVAYQYLRYFFEEDDKELEKLEKNTCLLM